MNEGNTYEQGANNSSPKIKLEFKLHKDQESDLKDGKNDEDRSDLFVINQVFLRNVSEGKSEELDSPNRIGQIEP